MSEPLTQDQLDAVKHLSSREAASILGVGKSTINRYRELARENGGVLPEGNGKSGTHKVVHEGATHSENVETKADGSLKVETEGDVPQTKDDIDQAMIKRGFKPEEYDFTYRFSEWQAQTAGGGLITMYAARAGAIPKRAVANAEALDVSELIEVVNSWEFTPWIKDRFSTVDMAALFADPQLGKVDVNGGTDDTVARVMGSYENLAAIAKEVRPQEIVFTDLGDGLENFYNTSSQRETNDLDLTSQVRLLRRLQAEGIRQLAPLCGTLTHMAVNSNHGSVRIAPQQQASTASNDWGLEVSHQLEDVFTESGKFDNVTFIRPDGAHAISVNHTTSTGTVLGATHGDHAGQQTRVGDWWMRQAFGWDNPLRMVQILLVGHFHNQATEEIYEGRHIVFGASSDRGSAWFTNRTGRTASSGMTTFLTAEGRYGDLQLV